MVDSRTLAFSQEEAKWVDVVWFRYWCRCLDSPQEEFRDTVTWHITNICITKTPLSNMNCVWLVTDNVGHRAVDAWDSSSWFTTLLTWSHSVNYSLQMRPELREPKQTSNLCFITHDLGFILSMCCFVCHSLKMKIPTVLSVHCVFAPIKIVGSSI